MSERVKIIIGGIVSLLLWESIVRLGHLDRTLFPTVGDIAKRLIELLSDSDFRHNVGASLWRLGVGSLAGTILAACVASLIALWPGFRNFISAPIYFLFPVPKVALFPFFLLIFGLGWKSQTALIAVGVFFLVYISLYGGVIRLLQSNLRDVLVVQGVPAHRIFYHFYLKGCVPDLITGLRSGLSYGLTLVVVSEMSGSRDGLGHFLWRAWDLFRITDLYCAVVIIGVIGFILNGLLDRISGRIMRRYSIR